MDNPLNLLSPEPNLIVGPGNAIFTGPQVHTGVERQPSAAKRTLEQAWSDARAWCKRPKRDVYEAIERGHPGAVQAALGMLACQAYRLAESKYKFDKLMYYGGHSFGFFVHAIRGALQASEHLTIMSCGIRGQAQVDGAWGVARHPFAHLINVPGCEDPDVTLEVLNRHVFDNYADLYPRKDHPCFGRAIRNVPSWTFWSRVRTDAIDLNNLGFQVLRFDHPGYHDPERMRVAAEMVRLFLNSTFDRSQEAKVPMVSGMNGRCEVVGPKFGDIIDRCADEISSWIDWPAVCEQFVDGTSAARQILSIGLSERTGRKDPVRAVSGGMQAPGKWSTIAV